MMGNSASRPARHRFPGSTPAGLAAALAALLAAGCAGEASVPIQPVSGKVLLANGKPLASGTVYLEPVNAPALRASGKIQSDGRFTLTTRSEGDGAAEGEGVVYIVPDPAISGKGAPPFSVAYTDPEASDLRVTVKAGKNELEPFVLQSALAKKATASRRTRD